MPNCLKDVLKSFYDFMVSVAKEPSQYMVNTLILCFSTVESEGITYILHTFKTSSLSMIL